MQEQRRKGEEGDGRRWTSCRRTALRARPLSGPSKGCSHNGGVLGGDAEQGGAGLVHDGARGRADPRQAGGARAHHRDGAEQDDPTHRRGAQDHHQGREACEGAALPAGGEQEEPGQDHRPGGQAAAEDQVVQEADRGGGGDRRHQPGQVQEGSAGLRGGGGAQQAVRGQHRQVQEHQGCLGNDPGTSKLKLKYLEWILY